MRRSTHEISADEKGKLRIGLTTANGQVEHGTRLGILVRSTGNVSSTAEVVRASPGMETVVELGSNGATDINPEIKTRSREGKVANDGVVELGSHRVALVENLRLRTAGAQTVGPMPNWERTEGLECVRFSERRQLT